MRTGISFLVTAADRKRLHRIIKVRQSPQKHVWRWQERFIKEGVAGLLYDKSHPSDIAPIEQSRIKEIMALTLSPHTERPRQPVPDTALPRLG